jgi:hypothetical protein
MPEPTPTIIATALRNAHGLMKANDDWDIFRALAQATTTAQCQGVEGFKVFRDTRQALAQVLPKTMTLLKFSETAPRREQLTVLERAAQVVGS